ncbi:MAG TPA: SRPBCC family protein [Methylomirabilota bacterium]|nr:SRPBCC family protein [Methylomirabilota bacterium]
MPPIGRGVLLGLFALAAVAHAAPAGEPTPTAEERQRLNQGEVVYRVGAAPRDGAAVPGARGGVAFVRVPTGPDPIWAILTAPRRYPEIFPGLRTVEVLEESLAAWLLRTDGKVGPFTFSYHTRYRIDPEARTLVWRLDTTRDNDVFDDNWGWWRLVPDERGTLVVYAIGSIPSSWQPLAGFFERRGIVQALAALREAAARRTGAARRPGA